MDNVCHTLVGAACAQAGLARRSRFASGALLVAANLPDVDVLVFLTDVPSVAFRRGWTHGVLAQALLPVALTVVLVWLDRIRPRPTGSPPLRAGWILGLGYLGVFSHVGLDFLNNYGVRLLAPLDWRWFYGDAVFIVDPWLWLVLGLGTWQARRLRAPRAAQGALVFAACYIALMLVSASAARATVANAWQEVRGTAGVDLSSPRALMVGPVPVNPLVRTVIVDAGDRYELGAFSWWSGAVTFDPVPIPKNATGADVAAARATAGVQHVLGWSRFPHWVVQPDLDGTLGGTTVHLRDARFAGAAIANLGASVVLPSGTR